MGSDGGNGSAGVAALLALEISQRALS